MNAPLAADRVFGFDFGTLDCANGTNNQFLAWIWRAAVSCTALVAPK